MTAYNREKYIAEAIESVLKSTYSNFELIIVDDCSKDQTIEIANEFKKTDSRVKIYQNEKNLGDYPNRNKAASYAKGKYLKYVDADDLIYPWGLEILVRCMEQFPGAGWGLCSLDPQVNKPYPIELKVDEIYRYNFFKKSIFHKAPLSSIITKKAFEATGGFTGKQHLGDFEFWHILALNSPVVLMCQGLVWFRNHNNQQSRDNRENPQVNLKYLVSQYNFLKSHSKILSLQPNEVKMICNRIKYSILKKQLIFLIRFDLKNFLQLLKMIKKSDTYNFTLPSTKNIH